jgi:hypothetical protein
VFAVFSLAHLNFIFFYTCNTKLQELKGKLPLQQPGQAPDCSQPVLLPVRWPLGMRMCRQPLLTPEQLCSP